MTGHAITATPCWACGSHEVAPTDRFAPAWYLGCGVCGLAFDPGRGEDEVRSLYDREYFAAYDHGSDYHEDPAQRRWEMRLRVRWLRAFATGGRLLDVGCAGGAFLSAARDAGFDVSGVEPAESAVTEARQKGFDVICGTLDELPPSPGSRDVVTAWHVLEHIPDPLATLERMRSELKPGGHLVLELPNAASVVAQRQGGAWHAAELQHHVGQYGPRSIRALVERAGFQVLDMHSFPFFGYYSPRRWIHPGYWLGYVLTAAELRANPFRRHPSAHELLRVAARA